MFFKTKPYYKEIRISPKVSKETINIISRRAHREYVIKASIVGLAIILGCFLIYSGITSNGQIDLEIKGAVVLKTNKAYPGAIVVIMGVLVGMFLKVNKYIISD